MAGLFTAICVIVTLLLFIHVWYRKDRFLTAWSAENRDLPLTTRWRLSVAAEWSTRLSEQCRTLRRKALVAEAAYLIWFLFLFLVIVVREQFLTP